MKHIIEEIIESEGGFVDHPDDLGGPTRYGITQKVAMENGYKGDMSKLPKKLAREIYYNKYIIAPGFDKIAELDEYTGELVVDWGVMSGPERAGFHFQRLLNVLNNQETWYEDLFLDGKVGPKSIQAFKTFLSIRGLSGKTVFAKAYKCLKGAYLIEISEKRKKNESFTYGWLANRV